MRPRTGAHRGLILASTYWKVKKKGDRPYLHIYPKGAAEMRKERDARPTYQQDRWRYQGDFAEDLVKAL